MRATAARRRAAATPARSPTRAGRRSPASSGRSLRQRRPPAHRHRGQRRAARPPRQRQAHRRRRQGRAVGRLGPQEQRRPSSPTSCAAATTTTSSIPATARTCSTAAAGNDRIIAYYGHGTIDCGAGQEGLRPDALAEQRLQGPQLRASSGTSARSAQSPTATARSPARGLAVFAVSHSGLVDLLGRLVVRQRGGGVDVAERRVPGDQRLRQRHAEALGQHRARAP